MAGEFVVGNGLSSADLSCFYRAQVVLRRAESSSRRQSDRQRSGEESRRGRGAGGEGYGGLGDFAREDEAGQRWVYGADSDEEGLVGAEAVGDIVKFSVHVGHRSCGICAHPKGSSFVIGSA